MIRPDIVESILEKPYWLIDVLPYQVPADSAGQYFKVEEYFLSRLDELGCRFADVLIRLNCYFDLHVSTDGEEWTLNVPPVSLMQLFEKSIASHSPLFILVGFADALVTFSGDDHNMTLYNPDDELLVLFRQCAQAEGLFLWGPRLAEP